MSLDSYELQLVIILTVGFAFASILGYLTQKARLSSILGYLLAGYLIGPYSPGFVADLVVSEQLSEIGVILMMFIVGLHFKWEDLLAVKKIAIPGAICQTLCAAIAGTLFIYSAGWSFGSGIVIGLSIGVASTVVLVRILTEFDLLHTPQGHIAVGWLVVEDLLTVAALILLPTLASAIKGMDLSIQQVSFFLILVLLKFIVLAVLIFTIGRKFVSYALYKIARTRSHELFTLTILALTFIIATGSAILFGISIALGAFLAGMIIGRTEVRHQVWANALPLKDAFAVIFFLSVGMLFNPIAIYNNLAIFLGILAIILIVKPLVALLFVLIMRYPFKTACTVAIALAQIGEFSFILSEQAMKYEILPDDGYDIIVACAFISISLNPLFFSFVEHLSNFLERKAFLPKSERKYVPSFTHKALVIGYGPIGKSVAHILGKLGYAVTVIDQNVDTIKNLSDENSQGSKKMPQAIYGDAAFPEILKSAQIEQTSLVVITIPNITAAVSIIEISKQLNPNIKIFARARYVEDQKVLDDLHVDNICCEEKAMKAFNDTLFKYTVARLK